MASKSKTINTNFTFLTNTSNQDLEKDIESLLFAAYNADSNTVVQLLANIPVLINKSSRLDSQGTVAIHILAARGDFNLLRIILAHSNNLSMLFPLQSQGQGQFYPALSLPPSIKLNLNTDINLKDNYGNICLHYSVEKNKKNVTELLIAYGANINHQNNSGNTPLHLACMNNNIEMVTLLLKYNSDPELSDYSNKLPRDKTNSPVIKSLIDKKIFLLKGGGDEEAKRTTQMMSFGVGLGVGIAVALAKSLNSNMAMTNPSVVGGMTESPMFYSPPSRAANTHTSHIHTPQITQNNNNINSNNNLLLNSPNTLGNTAQISSRKNMSSQSNRNILSRNGNNTISSGRYL